MEFFGRSERPRVLGLGIDAGSPIAEHLAASVPTVRLLESVDELDQVRQKDWDALIALETNVGDVEDHLFVLQFGGTYSGTLKRSGKFQFELHRSGTSYSQQFMIRDSVPKEVLPLVRVELAPIVVERAMNSTLGIHAITRFSVGVPIPSQTTILQPLVIDPDGAMPAAYYTRTDDENNAAQWWSLPGEFLTPDRWVSAVLEYWRTVDSDIFPHSPDWYSRPEWQTPEESSVRARLDTLRREHEDAVRVFAEREATLSMELDEVTQQADERERSLLTAQGEQLARSVESALNDLGFRTIDVDSEIASPGDLREDLRVFDPDDQAWVAIAEVRGYQGGAKLNDLLRIGRFEVRFLKEERRAPSAQWYVVNHFCERDPSSRPAPLAANPSEVETFLQGGGRIIDSRELFAIAMSVKRGDIDVRDGRRRLKRGNDA